MNNILYDSSAEFSVALSDIATLPRHQTPSSSDEFFVLFTEDSDWDILTPLDPNEPMTCPQCGGIVIPDGLLGFDCPKCGPDVIG